MKINFKKNNKFIFFIKINKDYSKEIINNKFNLIFYYSQGIPYDNAENLEECKHIIEKIANNKVDKIIYYNSEILNRLNYNQYIKNYNNNGVISGNIYACNLGFYSWKPLIIYLELHKLNINDILIYRDINCIKYPQYKNYNNFKNNIIKLLDLCKYDFVITRENNDYTIENFCKIDVIKELGDNHQFTYNFPLLIANLIIIKKTSISLELVKEWLNACNNYRWINGEVYTQNSDKFRWHTPEQSILSIIISNWIRKRKNGIPLNYPNIILKNREIDNIIIPNNYTYLKYIDY